VVEEGNVDPLRFLGVLSHGDVQANLAEDLDPASVDCRVRIPRRDVDDANAGGQNRVGAGWCTAVVAARLERDVKSGAVGSIPCHAQRHDFGVMGTGGLSESLADDQTVFDDDCAHCRIWASPPKRTIGQLERTRHEVHD
jgi:hypothetical protein